LTSYDSPVWRSNASLKSGSLGKGSHCLAALPILSTHTKVTTSFGDCRCATLPRLQIAHDMGAILVSVANDVTSSIMRLNSVSPCRNNTYRTPSTVVRSNVTTVHFMLSIILMAVFKYTSFID
jgi:hypothetical protein